MARAGEQSVGRRAPLGNRVVRVVAGFNIVVLAAVIGLAAARVVELVLPHTSAAILLTWALVAVGACVALARWGPLTWGPRAHGAAWAVGAVAALLGAAPPGRPAIPAAPGAP